MSESSNSLEEVDLIHLVEDAPFQAPANRGVALRLLSSAPKSQTVALTRAWLKSKPASDAPAEFLWTTGQWEEALKNIRHNGPDLREAITSGEVYSRLSSLWTLEPAPGNPDQPYWLKQVTQAWRVFCEARAPFFRTPGFQATQRGAFRRDVIQGALGRVPIEGYTSLFGATLESIAEASQSSRQLIESWLDTHLEQPALRRAQLARVLAYLGFHREALSLVPVPWDKSRWSPEDAYAVQTHLFIANISLGTIDYSELSERVFERIPICRETIRTRLALCIQAGAISGNLRDIERTSSWRERGEAILPDLESCEEFSTDEVGLLTSRWWRFACFIPFLLGDHGQLRTEVALYEQTARAVRETGETARENMYPAMETKARVCQFFGDFTGAVAALEEVTSEIDPYDAKAWLNLGDARERAGNIQGATSAFEHAARLGPPIREISWFRATRAHIALGDLESALKCCLLCVRADPSGHESLLAVAELSAQTGRTSIHRWAVNQLNQRQTTGRFPEQVAE
ncbi:MAG: tetratricopeptide repeat protein, partial [Akkermansiaceae bacterium]